MGAQAIYWVKQSELEPPSARASRIGLRLPPVVPKMPAALVLILSVASFGLAQSQPQLKSASRVCVENKASYALSFKLWSTADNMLSSETPRYYSPGQKCLNVWDLGSIEPGTPVVTIVSKAPGISVSLPPLLYSPASGGEGATANFSCTGASSTFACTLDGEEQQVQPGAIVAPSSSPQQLSFKGACVQNVGGFRLRIRLWDTATGRVGQWSQAFNQLGAACVDAWSLPGVASGHPLALIVSPDAAFPASFRTFLYDPNATRSALYVCSGNTAKYDCKIEGAWRRLQVLV